MKFDVITIFPSVFGGFLTESLLARAQKNRLLTIKTHDLRKWTNDKHKTVDDRPYGGGAGMVLKIEPIYKAVKALNSEFRIRNSEPEQFYFRPRVRRLLKETHDASQNMIS